MGLKVNIFFEQDRKAEAYEFCLTVRKRRGLFQQIKTDKVRPRLITSLAAARKEWKEGGGERSWRCREDEEANRKLGLQRSVTKVGGRTRKGGVGPKNGLKVVSSKWKLWKN